MSRELLQQALEALTTKSHDLHSEWGGPGNGQTKLQEMKDKAITALRQAIAQAELAKPEQESAVQHLWECLGRWSSYLVVNGTQANMAPPNWLLDAVKAATSPSRKEWVSLTDKQTEQLAEQVGMFIDKYGLAKDAADHRENGVDIFEFAKQMDAKLKEKNL